MRRMVCSLSQKCNIFTDVSCEVITKSLIFDAGKSAAIHYGTGAIAGFFSNDAVTVGDLVVKDQVKFLSLTYSNTLLRIYAA